MLPQCEKFLFLQSRKFRFDRAWRKQKRLWMSAKERDRLKVLHEVRKRVQWDTSEHDWLEGRGEKLYLIAMIDDATSRLSAGFVGHDSTVENLRQLRSYIEQHGRPVAV
jgi:hypothetical protein